MPVTDNESCLRNRREILSPIEFVQVYIIGNAHHHAKFSSSKFDEEAKKSLTILLFIEAGWSGKSSLVICESDEPARSNALIKAAGRLYRVGYGC